MHRIVWDFGPLNFKATILPLLAPVTPLPRYPLISALQLTVAPKWNKSWRLILENFWDNMLKVVVCELLMCWQLVQVHMHLFWGLFDGSCAEVGFLFSLGESVMSICSCSLDDLLVQVKRLDSLFNLLMLLPRRLKYHNLAYMVALSWGSFVVTLDLVNKKSAVVEDLKLPLDLGIKVVFGLLVFTVDVNCLLLFVFVVHGILDFVEVNFGGGFDGGINQAQGRFFLKLNLFHRFLMINFWNFVVKDFSII
jgi:hypothetical protein